VLRNAPVGELIAKSISVVVSQEERSMPALTKNIAEQLYQEHQMIGAVIKELRDLLEGALSQDQEPSARSNSVGEGLLSLNSHLKTHFAFEEFGGFMEEVVAASPNASPQVGRLKKDHQDILAESERLCRMARAGSLPSEVSQLRREVLHLLDLLNRHEHAENELVQRVLMDDLGTTD
jgi:hypothetical protein